MNILVACEESQEVCKAFREKGHNAFSCDLQRPRGGHEEWHILGDVTKLLHPTFYFLDYDVSDYAIIFSTMDGVLHRVEKWDMLIAFPPCTYLTKAGACNIPKDSSRIDKGFQAKEFFMKFYNANIPKICIENPIPMKRFGLPPKSHTINPYEFGEVYSKKTFLWLKGLPPLIPTQINVPVKSWCTQTHYAKTRSKTFTGIAKAMAEQWG